MSDCETNHVYDEELRRARKTHKCCECHREIARGEEYVYCHGIWGGDMGADSFKQHVRCWAFARHMNSGNHQDDCSPFGMVDEDVRGNMDEEEPLHILWRRIRDEGFEFRGEGDDELPVLEKMREKKVRKPKTTEPSNADP